MRYDIIIIMSGICGEVFCCGLPHACVNGCVNLCAMSLPEGTMSIISGGLNGCLSLCGSTCSALAGMVSGLLGGMLGGGGGITEALPAVMQNAGGGK